ncbi:DUF2922 domain-containing protein [Staphylococcus simulans]|uniref:DUF2922 domain-containing protein n=1 Tax=Staphylococcus simulans TaxID=1286 RepID=UPI000D1E202D|nr:DUF2922 domain-containing protein [Staphylococcus simulans]MDY5059831.1 DUF2922 domain-containing protein [Staphylococcus simulans]PTJ13527.1 DUF2922 domain-containing protein [Staphylococcus simulans]
MTKSLELLYINEAHKPVKFQVPDIKQQVSEESIRNAMSTLLESNVLNPPSGKIIAIKGAQIVEKETHVIF